MTLDGNQQIAAFLDELQRPIAEARTFTFSAAQPVAAIALRGFLNERGDFLMTTLPVADLSRVDSAMVVIPHFAEGGGWTTQIALVNSSDAAMTGTLVFFGQSGSQLETRTYTIAARSSTIVRRSSADVLVRVGSIRVNADAGQRTPVGISIFSYSVSGITVTETGVPTVAPASTFAIYGENSASLKSGFAFANASPQATTLTYEVFSSDGSAAGMSGSMEIPGNGQRALFLTELPGATVLPSSFKGVVRLTSSSGSLSVIGLRTRTNERGDFLVSTTMPDQNSSATGELYLPHFVHGGGYTTEFIFLGPSGTTSASGSIEFYSPAGQTLPLAVQ